MKKHNNFKLPPETDQYFDLLPNETVEGMIRTIKQLFIENKNKFSIIKIVRGLTGAGLKQSKFFVDFAIGYNEKDKLNTLTSKIAEALSKITYLIKLIPEKTSLKDPLYPAIISLFEAFLGINKMAVMDMVSYIKYGPHPTNHNQPILNKQEFHEIIVTPAGDYGLKTFYDVEESWDCVDVYNMRDGNLVGTYTNIHVWPDYDKEEIEINKARIRSYIINAVE